MDYTHSVGDGLMGRMCDGSYAWLKSLNTKIKIYFDPFLSFSFLYSIICSVHIKEHLCVMCVTHTSLTPLMPFCLCVCSDRYPCQALLSSSGWCLSAALTLHKASYNTVQLSMHDFVSLKTLSLSCRHLKVTHRLHDRFCFVNYSD